MRHTFILPVLLASIIAAGAVGADEPAPSAGAGWTGSTNPDDVITARQALMLELERLMRPVDSLSSAEGAVGEPAETDRVRESAGTIAAMLLVVPHLFPPTTNSYDPAAESPATLALPAIWQDFAGYYSLASTTSAAAAQLAATADPAESAAAARRLRASCDACHTLYLRPYVPAAVSDEDLEFDFESALPFD